MQYTVLCITHSTVNTYQLGCYLPTMLTFLVPTKVPGFPKVVSLHSMTKTFKLGFAVMVSVETLQDGPMGMLLAAVM